MRITYEDCQVWVTLYRAYGGRWWVDRAPDAELLRECLYEPFYQRSTAFAAASQDLLVMIVLRDGPDEETEQCARLCTKL